LVEKWVSGLVESMAGMTADRLDFPLAVAKDGTTVAEWAAQWVRHLADRTAALSVDQTGDRLAAA
jgi:hypothetical protein